MFTIQNLCYERDDEVIIDHLSFSVSPGEFIYIAGDNGKGKTTLLKLLTGILQPTSGNILWKNQSISNDPKDFYRHINYIGHKNAITLSFTPEENLFFLSRAYALKSSISEVLYAVGLSHKSQIPAYCLSAGQLRRITLAKLLLLDTPLWFLDEPYTALDNQGVAWLQAHIHQHLHNQGMVIMTSHQTHQIQSTNIKEIQL